MKINILSPGRFHVLDLARELDKNGFDVKFYSGVPASRCRKFGLPRKCCASLFLPLLPFYALNKIVRGKQWAAQLRIWVQDRLTALAMRKCDVVISMSGDFVVSLHKAKKQGATIIVERGSKHILEQKRILESIPSNIGKEPVPMANVKRELECYQLADYISIASIHVKRSFLLHNYPENKLFVNPYGVSLSQFSQLNVPKVYDVINVGSWSYQKGSDLILHAIRQLGVQFLHVGTLVDVPFEEDGFCHHVDAVDQTALSSYYNSAKIFILPSRQEGLAMVQAQAIACNLPVIGSPDSGAEDLQRMVEHPEYISIIREYSVEAVENAIAEALGKYATLGNTKYAGEAIENLTWEAYGRRYANFLNTL